MSVLAISRSRVHPHALLFGLLCFGATTWAAVYAGPRLELVRFHPRIDVVLDSPILVILMVQALGWTLAYPRGFEGNAAPISQHDRTLPLRPATLVLGECLRTFVGRALFVLLPLPFAAIRAAPELRLALLWIALGLVPAIAGATALRHAWRTRRNQRSTMSLVACELTQLALVAPPFVYPHPITVAASTAVGAALVLLAWRRLPAAWDRAEPTARHGESAAAPRSKDIPSTTATAVANPGAENPPFARSPGRALRWFLFRRHVGRGGPALFLGLTVFLAALTTFSVAFVWMLGYQLAMVFLARRHAAAASDHLPIPRAQLTRWMTLPTLVALLVGGALGAIAVQRLENAPRDGLVHVRFGADRSFAGRGLRYHIRSPLQAWRFAWGTPTVDLDGESYELFHHPVVPLLPLCVYDPYAITAEMSAAAKESQVRRAFAEVHGRSLDTAPTFETHRRELGGVAVDRHVLELSPPKDLVAVGPRYPVAGWCVLLTLTWIAMGSLVFRRNRPSRRRRGWFRIPWGLRASICLFSPIAVFLVYQTFDDGIVVRTGVARYLLAMDGVFDAVPAAAWALPPLLAWLGLMVLTRRFRRVESPNPGWNLDWA